MLGFKDTREMESCGSTRRLSYQAGGPEDGEERGCELGKSRGGGGRQVTPPRVSWLNRLSDAIGVSMAALIMIGLVILAFVVGFVALIVIDSQQREEAEPPPEVQEIDVGPSGQHTPATVDYEQNPPAGGEHNPVWQNSAFYEEPIRSENAVHTLEHGAVWITYSPDLPQDQQDRIREIVESQNCLLASPYPGLDSPVVASAWGYQIRLDSADDENLELERFIGYYERGIQTPEPGAACTGGTSDTVAA